MTIPDYRNMIGNATSLEEREWIRSIATELAEVFDDLVCVHIGVASGGSVYANHAGSPDAEFIGVDIDCSKFLGDLDIRLIEGDSAVVHEEVEDPIHFLFVDGDHEEEAVAADVRYWVAKLAPGGVVAFHDYYNDMLPWCVGVKAAVDAADWVGWLELPSIRSIRAFRRPL